MSFFQDIGDDNNAEGVEERMASGGLIPAGFHPAILNGARNTESKSNNTPGYELTFLITDGPAKGQEHVERVWKQGKDAEATSKCRDRVKMFAHRLGLIAKSEDGKSYLPVEGKESFGDVIDTAAIIEINHEPDRENKSKVWARLAWNGVHKADDPDALAAVKNGGKKPDKPGGAGQGKGAAAGSKPGSAPSKPAPEKPKRATARDI